MDDASLVRVEEALDEIRELTQENNKLLISLQRTAQWSFWGKLVLWALIIILPFIFLGPLLRSLVPATGAPANGSVFGLPSPDQVQELINAYQGNLPENQ